MSLEDSRRSASFLVRVWVENREEAIKRDGADEGAESEGEPGELQQEVIRAFVRNLQTGQERYVSSPERLAKDLFHAVRANDDELEADDDNVLGSGLASG